MSFICIFHLHVTNITHKYIRPAFDLVQMGKVLHNTTHMLRDVLHILLIFMFILHNTNLAHKHTRPAFDLVQVGKMPHNTTHVLHDMVHI